MALSRQRYGVTGRRQRTPYPESIGLSRTRPPKFPEFTARDSVGLEPERKSPDFSYDGGDNAPSFSGTPGTLDFSGFAGPALSALGLGLLAGAPPAAMAAGALKAGLIGKGVKAVAPHVKAYAKYGYDEARGSISALAPSEHDDPAGLSPASNPMGFTDEATGVGGLGDPGADTGGAVGGPGTSEGADPSGMGEGMGLGADADVGDGDGGGDGGGGGGGTALCTEIYRQGFMSDADYEADQAYGSQFDLETFMGYYAIALPVAEKMKTSKALTRIIKPFVLAWTQHSLFKLGRSPRENRLGATLEIFLAPVCNTIGKIIKELSHGTGRQTT